MFLVSVCDDYQFVFCKVLCWKFVIIFEMVNSQLQVVCVCLMRLMIEENLLICICFSSDVWFWICGFLVNILMFVWRKLYVVQCRVWGLSRVLLLMQSRSLCCVSCVLIFRVCVLLLFVVRWIMCNWGSDVVSWFRILVVLLFDLLLMVMILNFGQLIWCVVVSVFIVVLDLLKQGIRIEKGG